MSDFEPHWERVASTPKNKGTFAARQSTADLTTTEETPEAEEEELAPAVSGDPHPLAMWLWLFALLFLIGLIGVLAWQLFA